MALDTSSTSESDATTPTPLVPIDYDGALLIADMVRIFKVSDNTIRRRLREGTFPIPLLEREGLSNRLRWSGPVVRRWLETNGARLTEADGA